MRCGIAILTVVAGCGRVAFDARGDGAIDTVQGCDAPGGRWTDVPGGSFESGDIVGWSDYDIPGMGTAVVVQGPSAVGSHAVHMVPAITAFGGYALIATVAVSPSTRYVLSGYMDQSALTLGESLYFDLDDQPFDVNVEGVRGQVGWQFVWGVIDIPAGVTSVRARIVHDGNITPSRTAYADDLAVTPQAQFALPGQGCM